MKFAAEQLAADAKKWLVLTKNRVSRAPFWCIRRECLQCKHL